MAPPRSVKEIAARRLLQYGIPLALTGAVGILGGQLDRIVVTSNFSAADYSVYAIGAAQVPLLYLVRQPVNNVLVRALSARFEADDLSGAADLWRESMRKLSLVVMPAFVYSVIMAPDLIRFMYGSGWGASVEIFRIYQTLLLTQITTWGLIPMAAGRTRENIWGAVILLVLNGGIAYALIGPFGLDGAAVATPLATLGAIAYFLMRIRAVFHLPIRKLGPWTGITLNLLFSGVAGVPLFAFALLPAPLCCASASAHSRSSSPTCSSCVPRSASRTTIGCDCAAPSAACSRAMRHGGMTGPVDEKIRYLPARKMKSRSPVTVAANAADHGRHLDEIKAAYVRRDSAGPSAIYRFTNPAYLFHFQDLEWQVMSELRRTGFDLARCSVLEVGTGIGHILHRLKTYGAQRAVGIDLLESRIQEARRIHPTLEFVVGDAAQMPFADEAFDLVTQFTCFSSITNPSVRVLVRGCPPTPSAKVKVTGGPAPRQKPPTAAGAADGPHVRGEYSIAPRT